MEEGKNHMLHFFYSPKTEFEICLTPLFYILITDYSEPAQIRQ